jgi:hypothetical protein
LYELNDISFVVTKWISKVYYEIKKPPMLGG